MVLMTALVLLLFCIAVFFLIKGIRKNNIRMVIIAITGILLSFFLVSRIDLKNAGDFFTKELQRLQPRSPEEIYTVIFKLPVDSCVKVINTVDQVIPKIDCCVWLEFNTCPHELRKIINKLPYQGKIYAATDSLNYNPLSTARPAWWAPAKLGDSLYKMNYKQNSLTEITLLFNKDSTHVFCCDRAE